jgi:glycosyltransferase involved in cell wall biosynthesis
MGEVFPVADSAALAEALARVLSDRERYVVPRAKVESLFSTARTAELYEEAFLQLLAEKRSARGGEGGR